MSNAIFTAEGTLGYRQDGPRARTGDAAGAPLSAQVRERIREAGASMESVAAGTAVVLPAGEALFDADALRVRYGAARARAIESALLADPAVRPIPYGADTGALLYRARDVSAVNYRLHTDRKET